MNKFYGFILLLLPFIAFSQFGPGGVGNTSNNGLWLDAADIPAANNDPVGTWTDVSGNSNDALQPTGTRQPLFVSSSSINGRPALRLDGVDDQLLVTDADILDDSPGITYFAVLRPNNLDGTPRGILGKRIAHTTASEYAYTFFFYNSDRLTLDIHTQNNRFGTGISSLNAVNKIYGFTFDGSLAAAQRSKIYDNGTVIATGSESSTSLPNSNQPVCIGALNADYGIYLGADYAELIQYNFTLNTAQRIIVENYLGAKFNIPVINPRYDFGATHGDMVSGIGRVDASNLHNDAQGRSIVRINTPSSLNDGDYMLWGHNNASLADSNSVDVDQTLIESRMSRVWRVDETGDVGTVNVTFDFSGFSPATGSDLRLLIDRNGNGFADNDVAPISGVVSGFTITFSGVDFQYGDYFTLGSINATATPLPVTFLDFSVVNKDNSAAYLNWNVASEINADYYTIEKSVDGENWSTVNQIKANNITDKKSSYNYTDKSIHNTLIYYRLSQTDFDGAYNLLSVKSVAFDLNKETKIQIYPNPANDFITIQSNTPIQKLVLLNASGKVLKIVNTSDVYTIKKDVSDLSPGIYIIQTHTQSSVSSDKVIIK